MGQDLLVADVGADGVIGFAHRGARHHRRENTLDAFVHALRMGARALESDVWLSADGHAVLDHDGWAAAWRPARRRLHLRHLTRESMPSHIPTLDELYESCGTAIDLSLDLKDPGVFDAVVLSADAAGPGAVEHLWICDPRPERLLSWASTEPRPHYVLSTRASRLRTLLRGSLPRLRDGGIEVVNLRGTTWTPALLRRCHAAGMLAFAWDVQHRGSARRLLRWGVDGLYSDRVDLLTGLLGETRRGAGSEPAEA